MKAAEVCFVILAFSTSVYAANAVVEPPVGIVATNIYGGNGDPFIGQNECHLIYVTLQNKSASPITGLSVQLITPRAHSIQKVSAYPDLAPGAIGVNLTPFQLSTPSPLYDTLQASLVISSSNFQAFTIPIILPVTNRISDAGVCLECSEVVGTMWLGEPSLPFSVQARGGDCQIPPVCPTHFTNSQDGELKRPYRTYTYTNVVGNECVTVNLECSGGGSWAIRGRSLDFSRLCSDYLGGAQGSTNYSFAVGSGEVFTIVVWGIVQASLSVRSDFRLRLSPESLCPVSLSATLPSAGQFELRWPGYALRYLLETTPQLGAAEWTPVPIYPRITNGYFVIEEAPVTNRFYRLRKAVSP